MTKFIFLALAQVLANISRVYFERNRRRHEANIRSRRLELSIRKPVVERGGGRRSNASRLTPPTPPPPPVATTPRHIYQLIREYFI
jgi:hypothetical protein